MQISTAMTVELPVTASRNQTVPKLGVHDVVTVICVHDVLTVVR